MTAKLYPFPSDNKIRGKKMSDGFAVSLVLALFAAALLGIHRPTR